MVLIRGLVAPSPQHGGGQPLLAACPAYPKLTRSSFLGRSLLVVYVAAPPQAGTAVCSSVPSCRAALLLRVAACPGELCGFARGWWGLSMEWSCQREHPDVPWASGELTRHQVKPPGSCRRVCCHQFPLDAQGVCPDGVCF